MTLLAKRQERSIVPRMYYITTAIDYTNGPPHIGHAYEKVLADVLARWHRMKGEEVYFLTGVDQHGQKVQQTAEKLGITPQEHVNNITEQFLALWNRLGISNDGWASTTDPRHKACVQKILTDLKDKGQLYKKSYKGFSSVRQEQFLTDKERDAEGNLLPDDVRLTKVGKIVRSLSIDELPQLINVLKGDMALVGPRPLLIKYLPLYSEEQYRRHEVRPGITGWAQVNGRNSISWTKKFELDVWYVDHISFWLDIKIIFLTIKKVFIREGINMEGSATTEPFNGHN